MLLPHSLRAVQKVTSTAPYVVTSVDVVGGAGNTSTITQPAGTQVGDLLVVVGVGPSISGTWTSPAGWTERADSIGRFISTFVATSATGSHIFTSSAAGARRLVMLVIRNGSWGAVGTLSAASTNPVAPSFTVPANDSLLIGVVSLIGTATTYVTPSGWSLGAGGNTTTTLYTYTQNALEPSGASGTVTFARDAGSGSSSRAQQFSISPV